MTAEFKRLMVFGDWDHYYVTMNPRYQADIARALGKFVERGLVYKGKKPVHWCIHCRTALAEAEVEYEDHSSPSIYVEFPLNADERGGPGRAGAGAQWTRRLSPDLDDDAVDDSVEPRHRVSSGVRLRGVRRGRARGDRRRAARGNGQQSRRASVRPADRDVEGRAARRHPFPASAVRARLGWRARRLRDARGRYRCGAHGPRPRRRRLSTGRKYGLDIYAPVEPGDTSSRRSVSSAGSEYSTPTPMSRRRWRRAAVSGTAKRSSISTRTAGAVTTRSSSSRPRSGSCAWTATPPSQAPMDESGRFAKRRTRH